MFYIQRGTSTFKIPAWIVKLNSRKYYLKNKNQFLKHVFLLKWTDLKEIWMKKIWVLEILESKV